MGLDHPYQVGDIVSDLELSIGTSTLGMYNSFRDTLTVEMGKEVNQMEVLQQERSVLANSLRGLRVHDYRVLAPL